MREGGFKQGLLAMEEDGLTMDLTEDYWNRQRKLGVIIDLLDLILKGALKKKKIYIYI